MDDLYGPWVGFNPGDPPPADNVTVRVCMAKEGSGADMPSKSVPWIANGDYRVVAYRIKLED